jgi:hypothetical protein
LGCWCVACGYCIAGSGFCVASDATARQPHNETFLVPVLRKIEEPASGSQFCEAIPTYRIALPADIPVGFVRYSTNGTSVTTAECGTESGCPLPHQSGPSASHLSKTIQSKKRSMKVCRNRRRKYRIVRGSCLQ